jgi:hypothetical protein
MKFSSFCGCGSAPERRHSRAQDARLGQQVEKIARPNLARSAALPLRCEPSTVVTAMSRNSRVCHLEPVIRIHGDGRH